MPGRDSIFSVGLAVWAGALLLASPARADANVEAIVAADNALGLALVERLAATSGNMVFAGRVMDPREKSDSAGRKQANSNELGVRNASDRDDARGRMKELFKSKPAAPPVSGAPIGGPCSYVSYPGRCRILNVQMTSASIHQKSVGGGPGYEGYEVKFQFAGAAPADNKLVNQALEREHELRLSNSWYAGPRFLGKYGIATGNVFACALKVIEKGSCSPIVFEFPAINQTDYFEGSR